MQPDANVARLAREHGINDNMLFNWRHQYKQGKLNRRDNLPVETATGKYRAAPNRSSSSDGPIDC